jgi:hypothetical protein
MVSLNERKDFFIWIANKNFSVKNMYNDLVLKMGILINCWTWKANIALKIKIFLWYLKNGVILTKDNLVKRQWNGCSRCCFCREQETIQHLFFYCGTASFMWSIRSFMFGITKLASVNNLYGPWLRSFSIKQRNLVLIRVAAFCWALWISTNKLVFQRSKPKFIL